MSSIVYNKHGLSSREKRILDIFKKYQGNISETLIRKITEMNRAAVNKTVRKLKQKDLIQLSTKSQVSFYRSNLDKIEEVFE